MRSLLLALIVCLAWAGEPQPPPLIYVPYDKVPSADPKGAGVLLPYEEFRRLWDAAQRPVVDPARPPVGAALTAFELAGEVEGERAVMTLFGTVSALAEGWSSLDLPSGLALAELRASDPRAVLERTSKSLRLHLPAPGSYTFTAQVLLPVARDAAGGRSLRLVLPTAGSGRFDLLLPEAGAELTVNPAVAMATLDDGGRTRLRAVVGGQSALQLAWRAPVAAAAGEALVLAADSAVVTVGERTVATRITSELTILRRPLATLALRLPPGSQVLAVSCPDLRTWEVDGDQLRLHLHKAREGVLPLTLGLESLLPRSEAAERALTIALPQVIGAERQTGLLALRAEEGLSLTVAAHEGLAQVDPHEAGEAGAGAAAAFRYLAPPPPLLLTALRLEPDLRVQMHQFVRLAADETRIDIIASLNVRRAGVFALSAPLPEGWELVDAGGLAIDDARVTGSGAERRIGFALRSRLLGDGTLTLRFRAPPALPRSGAPAQVAVGMLALDGVRLARGTLAIAAPRSWSLSATAAEGLAGADARAVATEPLLAEAARALREDEEVALAWTWLGQAKGVTLAAAPRSRELIAHQEERIAVSEGGVQRTVTWRGEVRYSATPSLTLRLPAALAATAQIRAAGLAEKSVQPAADGLATIELRFQTPLLGAFTVSLDTSEPLPRLEAGKPTSLELAPIALDGATRRTVLVAVAREGSLSVTATAAGLDAIPAADLPPSLQGSGTIAAFRGVEAAGVGLAVERHDLVVLADAGIPLVAWRAVVGDDRRLRAVGSATIESRGRPHLELHLPAGGELLEVVVDGRQTRPSRRADGGLVIPLGERATAGSRTLHIAYEQALGEGELGWAARLALELPRLGGSAAGVPLPVERTVLALWLPERFAALGVGGELRRQRQAVAAPRPDGLTIAIPEIGARLDLARLGDGGRVELRLVSWKLVGGCGLALGALIAALGFALRRQPQRVATLVAAALVGAILASAAPPAWAPLALGCAIGAAVAAFVAGLAGFSRWRAARPLRTPTPPPASAPVIPDPPAEQP